jgi:two-component system, OmpR family, sensor kinase
LTGSRLRDRAAIAALLVALLAAIWYALSVAFLPEAPVPREIMFGAGGVCLVLFGIIGGLAIVEARARGRAEARMRRFLADASHELRTPIAGLQASAETLLRTSPGRAAREELVLRILREAHRAGRLVDDLLAMTRLEQGIPLAVRQFDLVPLAAAAVDVTRELAPGVSVELHAPDRSRLCGDPQRIGQILDNVLANARHATPDGGRIAVRVTNQAAGVQVEVTDTGPGVPAADRERVFERFTRLGDGGYPDGAGGNGLGLAIARGIATAHAGTLSCAEPAGGGARFVLWLPSHGGRETLPPARRKVHGRFTR